MWAHEDEFTMTEYGYVTLFGPFWDTLLDPAENYNFQPKLAANWPISFLVLVLFLVLWMLFLNYLLPMEKSQ